MSFDLFQLHNPNEDKTKRTLLRAYTETHKERNNGFLEATNQATKIHSILKRIDESFKAKGNINWRLDWAKTTGFSFKKSGVKEWLQGRSSIPLIAIKNLAEFAPSQEFDEIKSNLQFVCTTTKGTSNIPKELTPDLAYLAAAILCDGHLRSKNHSICIELVNENTIKKFQNKFHNAFGRLPRYSTKKKEKSTFYYLQVGSKPISRFFTVFFGIPKGKKSDSIEAPQLIKEAEKEIRLAFIEGVFDTDGGKRKRGYGLTSASKRFRDDVKDLLQSLGVEVKVEEWLNKKYNKKYYGLYFHKKYYPIIAGVR